MAVDGKHPQYTSTRRHEWSLLRDAADGESAIKAAGPKYLPVPSGFLTQPDNGAAAYGGYIERANFPEILAPSLSSLIGIAHGREIQIEIPAAMEYLWEDADGAGMPLEKLHRRITRELLLIGRYGLLADAPSEGGEPYLAGYVGESVINWDRDFFVLDETGPQREDFDWKNVVRHRVLRLEDGRYVQEVYEGETATTAAPASMGGKPLDVVPFSVASAFDVKPDIRTAPLIGVARAAKAIYQLDADQRWQLYMSGQETLVGINCDPPSVVGAGVSVGVHGSEGMSVDVKYVSPTCSGIEAHGAKIEDKRAEAIMAGARLLEQSDSVEESGSARSLRFASETATLLTVLQSSCALLERGLRHVAMLKGLPTDEIVVSPPNSLLDTTMTPADAAALVSIWQNGAISYETLHENLLRGGIASPERDVEAELALLDKEDAGEDPEADGLTPTGYAR